MEYSSETEKADLMFMLVLNETINRLAMASSVHVLWREDGHVL